PLLVHGVAAGSGSVTTLPSGVVSAATLAGFSRAGAATASGFLDGLARSSRRDLFERLAAVAAGMQLRLLTHDGDRQTAPLPGPAISLAAASPAAPAAGPPS